MEAMKLQKRVAVSAMLDPKIVLPAIGSSFAKLDPRLMIKMTPTTRPTNRPPVVGNVPADGGIDFFEASDPASAIAGTIMKKRPTNIELASVRL